MEQQLLTKENNATLVYQRMPNPMEAIEKMGQMFASSGMFGCSKLEQGQVLALACLVQGKDPFELMQNYYIINGSLSMKSVAVLANFQKAGGRVTWHSKLNDIDQAKASFSINGEELPEAVYTIEDAKREGLIAGPNKHNWSARPADMLRARLITKAVRMLAPGIIMGMNEETDPPVTTAAQVTPLLKPGETFTPTPLPDLPDPEPATFEEMLAAENIPQEQAVALLVHRKLLEEGQTLKDMSKQTRGRVTKNFTEFVKRVREHSITESKPITEEKP